MSKNVLQSLIAKMLILLQVNVKPNIAKVTQENILEVGWSVLHLLYYPDLAPTNKQQQISFIALRKVFPSTTTLIYAVYWITNAPRYKE
uniref:Putative secreted protein n=1 Tax=Panstrongylus lignarius TaxID=156445 RepID=A0A224XYZ3_9HEMI